MFLAFRCLALSRVTSSAASDVYTRRRYHCARRQCSFLNEWYGNPGWKDNELPNEPHPGFALTVLFAACGACLCLSACLSVCGGHFVGICMGTIGIDGEELADKSAVQLNKLMCGAENSLVCCYCQWGIRMRPSSSLAVEWLGLCSSSEAAG